MSYLVQLRSFLDVYRAGSISKAANRLGISQPAVSSHIHSLESLTGCVLFIRRSHGVTPTAEADELARQIGHNLDAIETKLTLMRGRRKRITGVVTIIGPAELLWAKSAKLFSPVIHNELRLKLLTGDRKKIYASLNEGTSQIAITTSQPDAQKFGFQIIGKEKLIIVSSATMAANFKGKPITAELLESLPLIAYDEQLPLIRDVFKQIFGMVTDMQASITVPDLRIVERMIREHSGWTVMPEYLCQEEIDAGRIIKINLVEQMPENDIYLVWNESALRQPSVMFVKEHIIRVAETGVFKPN
ncbi:putative LysR-family transcriptional regulator [Xenorhabdus poinarii G6]|uniref:Putative LysR-family transcriptional regulator n=1 Tax=Xenorhabdus poinarii G6 TaxID=1354304 RepID=A0A068R3L1_9GAMM|nr:LysR family transcriptional regulator [Xenorhabdus poinarii]CDG21516.1 putative LysR-family transcriptional regulator [Xenorhabdus poinarii G6]